MLRKLALWLFGGLAVVTGLFLAGPRVNVAYQPRMLALPDDLDAYLQKQEQRFPGLTPGTEKTIVWARPDRAKTPLAIVYLHGFSATRQETAPVCDEVAARLGANLFYARLTGHGLDGPALAEATVDDWLNDAVEALRIGQRLGERVVVVGCSAGAALATWLAANTDDTGSVLAYVLISPNFRPRDPSAKYLTWPWARQWIPAIAGKQRQSAVMSERHGRFWTTSYPTEALIPMMGVCETVTRLKLERLQQPVLIVYSPTDQVVDVDVIQTAFERWGAKRKTLLPFTPREAESHVIAGAIRAPSGTAPIAAAIVDFVETLREPAVPTAAAMAPRPRPWRDDRRVVRVANHGPDGAGPSERRGSRSRSSFSFSFSRSGRERERL